MHSMRKFFLPFAVLAALLSTQVANAGFSFSDFAESVTYGGCTPHSFGTPTSIPFPLSNLSDCRFGSNRFFGRGQMDYKTT